MFQFFPPKFSMSHLISIGIKLTIEMSMKKKKKINNNSETRREQETFIYYFFEFQNFSDNSGIDSVCDSVRVCTPPVLCVCV